MADADRLKDVQTIDIAKKIDMEEGQKNISHIQNQVFAEQQRVLADVGGYVANSEAEANQNLLTDNYIKLQLAKSLANNTKMFFSGSDSAMGAILNQILGNRA